MFRKSIGIVTGLIGGIYLFSIAPNKNRKEKMKVLENYYIAHRGLFNNESNAPENSIPSFERAVNAGYGIELDVQLTTDNKLVVFHDKTLERMCGITKKLIDCSYNELKSYPLAGSKESIPLFEDVLRLINGKVPLIIEIKSDGDWKKTTKLVAKLLNDYTGYYCIESFHPLIVKWFKDNRPEIIRGQLSTDYFRDHIGRKWYEKFVLTNLMLNFITRPDFIAYNHLWMKNISYTICRTLFQVENVGWTIRSQDELDKAEKVFDVIIFDSFIPK